MPVPTLTVRTTSAPGRKAHYEEIASILRGIMSTMEYAPLDRIATNEKIEDAMRAEMETRNIACEQLQRTLHLCACFAESAYYPCNFEEKKNVALFTWYLFYVDDMTSKNPAPFAAFQRRFLSGKRQLDPVLDALVDLLLQLWKHYDELSTNFLMDSVFQFFTSTCIEPRIERATLVPDARSFPWFVRRCTGAGQAFAILVFPKSANFEIMDIVQVLPDMDFWISMWNDILSFYKEELAGETSNYVHNKAYVDGKAPIQILATMAEEADAARRSIYAALARNPKALRTWQTFERGYIWWHLAQDRYRLKDLSL